MSNPIQAAIAASKDKEKECPPIKKGQTVKDFWETKGAFWMSNNKLKEDDGSVASRLQTHAWEAAHPQEKAKLDSIGAKFVSCKKHKLKLTDDGKPDFDHKDDGPIWQKLKLYAPEFEDEKVHAGEEFDLTAPKVWLRDLVQDYDPVPRVIAFYEKVLEKKHGKSDDLFVETLRMKRQANETDWEVCEKFSKSLLKTREVNGHDIINDKSAIKTLKLILELSDDDIRKMYRDHKFDMAQAGVGSNTWVNFFGILEKWYAPITEHDTKAEKNLKRDRQGKKTAAGDSDFKYDLDGDAVMAMLSKGVDEAVAKAFQSRGYGKKGNAATKGGGKGDGRKPKCRHGQNCIHLNKPEGNKCYFYYSVGQIAKANQLRQENKRNANTPSAFQTTKENGKGKSDKDEMVCMLAEALEKVFKKKN